MKRIAVVFGEKLSPIGKSTYEFEKRLDKAAELAQQGKVDEIIISGSDTRRGFKTEAAVGYEYLSNKVTVPIVLDHKARTTTENVLFTKLMLIKQEPLRAYIITSKKRIARVKMLCRKLCGDLSNYYIYIGTDDRYNIGFYLVESLYYIFCLLDPKERTIASFTKRLFRNS